MFHVKHLLGGFAFEQKGGVYTNLGMPGEMRQPSSVGGRLVLSARIYQQRRQVGENASGDQNRAEEKAVHAENGFLLAANDGQDQQERRANSEQNCAANSSVDLERPRQFRFTDAQENQCQKFEDQAEAGNEQVQGNQPFESV